MEVRGEDVRAAYLVERVRWWWKSHREVGVGEVLGAFCRDMGVEEDGIEAEYQRGEEVLERYRLCCTRRGTLRHRLLVEIPEEAEACCFIGAGRIGGKFAYRALYLVRREIEAGYPRQGELPGLVFEDSYS